MKIWLVEHRCKQWADGTFGHVASTREKAIEWILANKDFDLYLHQWWWHLSCEKVDATERFGENWSDKNTFVSIDGVSDFATLSDLQKSQAHYFKQDAALTTKTKLHETYAVTDHAVRAKAVYDIAKANYLKTEADVERADAIANIARHIRSDAAKIFNSAHTAAYDAITSDNS